MKKALIKQFEYELWANKMILEALRKINDNDERSLLLFSHLLSGHSMWMSRIKAEEFTTTLFQERNLDEIEVLMYKNAKEWNTYLQTMTESESNRVIHFIYPPDGSKRKMSIGDALTHLISHSAYHRGQIVARMKGKIEPMPHSTYIAYASEADV